MCVRVWFPVEAGVALTHLFFLEYYPVEEELQILICIIDAKLFEAVEGQILLFPDKIMSTHRNTHGFLSLLSHEWSEVHNTGLTSSCLEEDLPQIHKCPGWRWRWCVGRGTPGRWSSLLTNGRAGSKGSWQLHLWRTRVGQERKERCFI